MKENQMAQESASKIQPLNSTIYEHFQQERKSKQNNCIQNYQGTQLSIKLKELLNKLKKQNVEKITNKVCEIFLHHENFSSQTLEQKQKILFLFQKSAKPETSDDEEKELVGKFFKNLISYSTARNYVQISSLFLILVHMEYLQSQQINYAFFIGIICSEFVAGTNLKHIIHNYRLIYPKIIKKSENFFLFVSMVIFLTKSKETQDIQIVKKILNHEQFIYEVLNYRHFFPKNKMSFTKRNFSQYSKNLVDNHLMKTLFHLLGDFNFKDMKMKVKFMVDTIMKTEITVLILKNLLKKLQVSEDKNEEVSQQKWKQLFQLMERGTEYFPSTKKYLHFESKNSYIIFSIPKKTKMINLTFKSFENTKQLVLLMLIGQKEQLVVSIRKHMQNTFILSFLKFRQGITFELSRIQAKWTEFQDQKIMCEFKTEKVAFFLQNANECKKLIESQIVAEYFVIGDCKHQMGTYVHEVSEIKFIYENQKEESGMNAFSNGKQKKGIKEGGLKWNQINFKTKESFISLIAALGDLDLFFLTISHLIKKISKPVVLVKMMSSVMHFIDHIAKIKQVKKKQLTQQQNLKRTSNILCLCWSISHHKKGSAPIFELLRFLKIRQIYNINNLIELLSNFVLWKNFTSEDHHLIIEKIKELFHEGYEKQHKIQVLKLCKTIIFDLVIFYSHTKQLSEKMQRDFLFKQADILQLIFQKMKETLNHFIILEFIQFLVKIMFSLIDRTRHNEFVDMTIGLQISNLLIQLSCFLLRNKQKLYCRNGGSQYWEDKIKVMIDDINLWNKEITDCLENEIIFIEENQIVYYNWKEKQFVNQTENTIKKNLYAFYIYLVSYSPITLFEFVQKLKFDPLTLHYFWEINFIQNDDPISLKEILTEYYICQQICDDKLIKSILKKYLSFNIKVRFPRFCLEKMKINSIKYFHDFFMSTYQTAEETEKVVVCEKILQILVGIPAFTYTNGKKLLEEMHKFERNSKVIEIINTNLIIKELSFEVNKLTEKTQLTSSTIFALDQINTQELAKTEEEQPITISYEEIKKCLEEVQLLAQINQIKKFYNLQTQNEEQVQNLIQNFQINIRQILDSLISSNKKERIIKLRNSIFFIQKHIYPFSQMIIYDYIFPQPKERLVKKTRKKSLNVMQNEKIKKQSSLLFQNFLKQRRKSLLKIENFWNKVEKNNKYFWQIFIAQENKHQSIDTTINNLNAKMLIKIDSKKRTIQLPKMVISGSIRLTASLDSDRELKNDDGQSESSIFSDVKYYRRDSHSDYSDQEVRVSQSGKKQNFKLRLKNQCSVFWVTNTTIYQGILSYYQDKIVFTESEEPNQVLYDAICVNPNERRSVEEIEKHQQKFEIKINKFTKIIPKRYLYYEVALEIYTGHQSYFFSLRKKKNRQKILDFYSKLKGTITSQKDLKSILKIYTERWRKGLISNFTYLMHLNNLCGRSFNDTSQYYIFPWTVRNFEQKMDEKFFENKNNFRQMGKPVGCLNKKRFEEIEIKYKETYNYSEIQPYLFGSFYSNPAIVCNYLVRLQPFSFLHFLLQKDRFDLPDRLFHSIQDMWSSCSQNLFDYKELIPEFYFCPEFLRNRSTYDFGHKQNKQLVHNVTLPPWGSSPQEFIFNMRKCLESEIITRTINEWIDLIFGVYNTKQRGMQKNNLFAPNIYKNQLSKKQNKKDRQSCLIFYKEFGQVARCLFEENHPQYELKTFYYPLNSGKKELVDQKSMNPVIYLQNQFFLSFAADVNELYLMSSESNSLFDKKKIGCSIKDIRILNFQGQNKKLTLLLYSQMSNIVIRQIKEKMIFKTPEIKEELSNTLIKRTSPQILRVFDEENMIITAQGSTISFFTIEENQSPDTVGTISISKKSYLYFVEKPKFTQHRSSIMHIKVSKANGLLVSIDTCRKVFIIKLNNEIEVSQSFRLSKLSQCQEVKQLKIHDMCYIVIFTSLSYIYVYNFMGDLISYIDSSAIASLKPSEQIECMQIWNHESPQLVLGTNKGRIVKINWFDPNSSVEVIGLSNLKIKEILMERLGRHWKLYASTEAPNENNPAQVISLQSEKMKEVKKINLEHEKKIIIED